MKNKAFIIAIVFVLSALGAFLAISNKTEAYGNCYINSFYPSPANISYGGSTTLTLNTSGCQSLALSGGTYSNYSIVYGTSMYVGPIYQTTTYTVVGYDQYGNRAETSTTVFVDGGYGQNGNGVATTNAATNITSFSATLNGYINCGYGVYGSCNNVTSYRFNYGTSQYSLYNSTGTLSAPYGSGSVQMQVSNLQPNTTYYYQLVTMGNGGTNYGNTLSFYTGNSYNQPTYNQMTTITSIATNIEATSARLNGVATVSNGTATTYFEYGPSTAFGSQTSAQTVIANTVNNYYDSIPVSPNTTYYFRIVGITNGQKFTGETATFTTPGTYTYVPPTTTTTVRTNNPGTGTGTALASLTVVNQSGMITPGNAVNYSVNYQNISNGSLNNAVLNVILPKGLVYQHSSNGVPTTDNTVTVILGTVMPGQSGTLFISTMAETTITDANNMVAEAVLAFTAPSGAQDSAIAYALNNWNGNMHLGNNNLAGLALFGGGFFPTSLLGWILLIVVLLLIIFVARYFFYATKPVAKPAENHVYYRNPVDSHTVDGVHPH